jgi:lambda family phage portal protein
MKKRQAKTKRRPRATGVNRSDKLKSMAKVMTMALTGGYDAADKSRRDMMSWLPGRFDADGDTLRDLPRLRELCRDAIRNTPIIGGALNTMCSHVIADGLTMQSKIDAQGAGISEDEARAKETQIERWWKLWSESKDCDIKRQLTFKQQQKLVYRSSLENGDALTLPIRTSNQSTVFNLRLQNIEADRLSNPKGATDTRNLSGGITKTNEGLPETYHIADVHPGSRVKKSNEWTPVAAFQTTSRLPNVLHVTKPLRIGQTRGVPFAAPVLILTKMLARYTDAELMGALVNAMLNIFIEPGENSSSVDGEILGNFTDTSPQPTGAHGEQGYELGNGAIIDLEHGDKIHTVDPTRPNVAFDGFVMSIMRQMGAALGMPYEVLVQHFTASYAAARASLLEAWRTYENERAWFVETYCRPVAESFLWELFSTNKVAARGYFTDPIVRKAYNGMLWIGKGQGQIDPLREINAAVTRIDLGVSTYSEVTAEMTGGDWETKHRQLVKERELRREAGFEPLKVGETPDTVD